MNPYVGLEQFFSWENCGIQRGKLISEKDFIKHFKEGTDAYNKAVGTRFEHVDPETGEVKVFYFEDKPTARSIVVRHLCEEIKPNELFTPRVITNELLHELDENFIQQMFKLPNVASLGDLENEEIGDLIDDSNED